MNFKKFVLNLQAMPEEKKKIFLWTIVFAVGAVLLVVWVTWTVKDLSKFNANGLALPKFESKTFEMLNQK